MCNIVQICQSLLASLRSEYVRGLTVVVSLTYIKLVDNPVYSFVPAFISPVSVAWLFNGGLFFMRLSCSLHNYSI